MSEEIYRKGISCENHSRRRFITQAMLALAAAPLLLAPEAVSAGGLFSMPSPADQKKVGDQAAAQVIRACYAL